MATADEKYIELLDDAHRGGLTDGRLRNVRTWRVFDIEHPAEILSLRDRPFKQGAEDPDYPDLVSDERNARWRPVRDRPQCWDIIVPYQQLSLGSGVPGDPDNPRNATASVDYALKLIDAWWYPPFTVPGDPNAQDGGQGGEENVQGGFYAPVAGIYPIDLEVRVNRIDIDVEVDFIDESLIDANLGTRNLTQWRGYPAGKVLFIGASAQGVLGGEVQRARFSFVSDQYFHLRQVPRRDAEGEVILDGNGYARYLRWEQPFKDLVDFNTLFNFGFILGGSSLGGGAS